MEPSLIDTVQTVILFCTFVTGLSAAINVFSTWHRKAKSPEKIQNDRIDRLEQYARNDKQRIEILEKNYNLVDTTLKKLTSQTAHMQEDLDGQKKRVQSIERGERVTQHAILAIIEYLANVNDGQDKTSIKQARKNLHEYLVGK